MASLLIVGIVFGTVFVAELPDNSGLASLVLGTRYRPGWVLAGAAAAFAVHVVLAVAFGSLLGLLPHRIVQFAVAAVFLTGAVLVLRADHDDDDEALRKADAAGFWAVATTSFAVILLAELGDEGHVTVEAELAKLSVLGVGIRTHTGVATRMFRALAERSINIALISTSEMRINVVTALNRGREGLECLRRAFHNGSAS